MCKNMNSCMQVKYNLKKYVFFLQREGHLIFTEFNITTKNIETIRMKRRNFVIKCIQGEIKIIMIH